MGPVGDGQRSHHILTLAEVNGLEVVLGLVLVGSVVLYQFVRPENKVPSVPLLKVKSQTDK